MSASTPIVVLAARVDMLLPVLVSAMPGRFGEGAFVMRTPCRRWDWLCHVLLDAPSICMKQSMALPDDSSM